MTKTSWADFKTFVSTRSLPIQEVIKDDLGIYELYAYDGPECRLCIVDKETPTPAGSNQEDYENNFQSSANESPVLKTQNRPSSYEVSLRIEGDTWTCPSNTTTTHYIALNDDYETRGAEFQFVNGKAGDFVEVWVSDKDGIVYPAGTRLTKYIEKFCVYEHEPGSQAWVADLVDDDTSDIIPSIFYFEFAYTNNQISGDDVKAIVNFWMYKRT